MGNYLEMADVQRIKALLELGWSYRRIQRETGINRETAVSLVFFINYLVFPPNLYMFFSGCVLH